jgi:uncharacterized protein (TIGR00251 family)
MIYAETGDQGIRLHCHIQPRATRDAIAGLHGGLLKVQITAPPADGRANDHLIRFIAAAAGVAKSRVTLVSGHSSRHKTLFIADLESLPEAFPPP